MIYQRKKRQHFFLARSNLVHNFGLLCSLLIFHKFKTFQPKTKSQIAEKSFRVGLFAYSRSSLEWEIKQNNFFFRLCFLFVRLSSHQTEWDSGHFYWLFSQSILLLLLLFGSRCYTILHTNQKINGCVSTWWKNMRRIFFYDLILNECERREEKRIRKNNARMVFQCSFGHRLTLWHILGHQKLNIFSCFVSDMFGCIISPPSCTFSPFPFAWTLSLMANQKKTKQYHRLRAPNLSRSVDRIWFEMHIRKPSNIDFFFLCRFVCPFYVETYGSCTYCCTTWIIWQQNC